MCRPGGGVVVREAGGEILLTPDTELELLDGRGMWGTALAGNCVAKIRLIPKATGLKDLSQPNFCLSFNIVLEVR